MSGVTIIAIIMGIIFGLFILAGFFFGFMKIVFPDFKYFIKYKLRKKTPNEKDIEFLINLIESGKTRENVVKEALLTNRCSPKKANELKYLFLEVEKDLKGGMKE